MLGLTLATGLVLRLVHWLGHRLAHWLTLRPVPWAAHQLAHRVLQEQELQPCQACGQSPQQSLRTVCGRCCSSPRSRTGSRHILLRQYRQGRASEAEKLDLEIVRHYYGVCSLYERLLWSFLLSWPRGRVMGQLHLEWMSLCVAHHPHPMRVSVLSESASWTCSTARLESASALTAAAAVQIQHALRAYSA